MTAVRSSAMHLRVIAVVFGLLLLVRSHVAVASEGMDGWMMGGSVASEFVFGQKHRWIDADWNMISWFYILLFKM